MGALNRDLYTMIVTMAVVTTMAMPPMLRAALARVPMANEEKVRIEREEIDERGYLPGLERLLLAVDESAAGKFLARLVGLLAGARGMPVTILELAGGQVRQDGLAREVKSGAKASAAKVKADDAEPDPEKVHVTERPAQGEIKGELRDAVAGEAQKGYDLLFVGLENARDRNGDISAAVAEVARGFNGNLGILIHDGAPERLGRKSRLLIAVNGTETSRRAAETTFALARATGAQTMAIYVSRANARTRRQEEEVLKDITRLAERYNVETRTRIAAQGAAAAAILKEGTQGYDMIVMGVSMRPGEKLFFGNTAAQILAGWEKTALLLAFRSTEQKRDPGAAKENPPPAASGA
jgi:nucleotide-binding universal stress UspA family protein